MTGGLLAKCSKLNDETRIKNEFPASYICGHGKNFLVACSFAASPRNLQCVASSNTFCPHDLRISVTGAIVRGNSIKVMPAVA